MVQLYMRLLQCGIYLCFCRVSLSVCLYGEWYLRVSPNCKCHMLAVRKMMIMIIVNLHGCKRSRDMQIDWRKLTTVLMSFCPVLAHKTVEKMFVIGKCYIKSLLFGYCNICINAYNDYENECAI